MKAPRHEPSCFRTLSGGTCTDYALIHMIMWMNESEDAMTARKVRVDGSCCLTHNEMAQAVHANDYRRSSETPLSAVT